MASAQQPPQPQLSTMSVLQLKRELMELHDSSFVFNDRDELECALKAARRSDAAKKRAGLARRRSLGLGGGGGSLLASAAAAAAAAEAAATSAVAEPYSRKESAASSSSSSGDLLSAIVEAEGLGATPTGRSSVSEEALAAARDEFPPDLTAVSVSSLTTTATTDGASSSSSRGTTPSSSVSPPPAPRPKAAAAAKPAAEKEAPADEPKNETADAFDEEEEEPRPESDSVSRRLVEYFVMVSSLAVDDSVLPKGDRARRKSNIGTPSRPPDPSRDKMNSRTRGRFDVRRVHLSNNLASSMVSAANSAYTTDDEGEEAVNCDDDESGEDLGSTLLEPKITARYPPKDHADQPLNLRLPQFCHPEGTDLIHPTTEYKMPRVHHFVLTDSMGGKQYGTALTVLEEFGGRKDDKTCGGKRKKKRTYYAPRVLVLLSTWPYLTAFRTYLTQLYRLATATDVMTAPIERYVQNICAEVPAPPPGAFEVQLDILGKDIRFWAPPANQPIPYVSLPFRVLFECLDIGNILFAWYTLACERKMLLVSSQLSLLTVCAEILNSLLFPMKWSHLYIPVLPRSLSPMLDAPMPYLCGISRENFPYAVEDISDETVVVDLDRNVITLGPNTPDLPPLPHNRRRKLEAALKANAGEVFWEARNLTKADVLRVRANGDEGGLSSMLDKAGAVWDERVRSRDDAFGLCYAPDSVNLQIDEDANVYRDDGSLGKQSRWDAVQEAFLRFYVSLLQDYRKFLPEGSMDERTTWRGKEGLSSLRFKTDEFVAASPVEFRPFLEELALTQQFDDFVTRKMHNAADAPDIKFFDQSIDAKRNRSKLKLKKKETPFLHSASAHRDLKRVRAVEPSGEGLPPSDDGRGVYMYEMWPLDFDERLFGTPRPIPGIISAEFDRRTALRSMLRSKYGIVDDSRGLGGRNRSPEVTAFVLWFSTFTSVIGKEMSSVERKHGSKDDIDEFEFGYPSLVPHASGRSARQSLTDMDDDMEAARVVAKAQIDLGYHTLALMRLRKLPPEPVAYKLLIRACGRTRVTHRASALMDMLARDGLATNSEIYTSLINAFSNDESRAPSSLAFVRMGGDDNMSSLSTPSANNNHLSLEKNTTSSTPSEHSTNFSESAADDSWMAGSGTTGSGSGAGGSTRKSMKNAVAARFSHGKGAMKMKGGRKITTPKLGKKNRHGNLKLTKAVAKQIELGESLLESLYPGIEIDAESVCPKCAATLGEDDISAGWTPCASNEYRTGCPACGDRFVPKFSVSCGSPSFEGSQGRGTPLYCDHLSPWVLLREIRSAMAATAGGMEGIIDEQFRGGSDISATLWWNMVVTFRRYKLPFIFLLQGSFQNQLILPSPSLNESNHTDVSHHSHG